ncbi:ABC transporter permease [Nocardia seriolae]|uniref:ABC transporter permease n=1 Tax=Nocardia seriolae TaxID=37332 RepID=A0A0B8NDH5_9NOCA|nr:ABC transporter permease [Nocardia seriolae]GEM27940.1 ABC transporter permease [Nocardia seriolae NBRC 15557]APA97824.1 Spermidine/putrescine transport system permease protein PotB [Nocardia seriolae]MTJ64418.1 ABC transporter permease subunit [Nocardia seriolae]MTJ75390.1 ABC transporter permease subunit [Nocardia seriolae]MTJ87587.1 ABC transporter permease subunit [Nocardia seriolae]
MAVVTTAVAPLTEPGRKSGRTPYLLLAPGVLCLLVLFAIPVVQLAAAAMYDRGGSIESGYTQTLSLDNFGYAWQLYHPQIIRSLVYSLICTALCVLLGYPLAYAIAMKGGRWKNLMLVAVIAPFFTSFLVRTFAWKAILADSGELVRLLEAIHLLGADGRLLATPVAVIAGLVYNFLPFMVLPLFTSLDKLDPRLLEASADLAHGPVQTFRRVTLPLTLPGIVAGTLLTFVPATGDYVNAQLLGNTNTTMIGNVIQSRLLVVKDLPVGSALSVMLMVAILVLVLLYLRRTDTDEVV